MRYVKVMAEYRCWPLWWDEGDEGIGNVDPRTLPLSPALVARLDAWAERLDSILDGDYPPDSRFAREPSQKAFVQEGPALTAEVQRELGLEFVFRYLWA